MLAAPSSCRCWESSARHGVAPVPAPAVGGFIVQFARRLVRRAGRGGRTGRPAGRNRAGGNARTRLAARPIDLRAAAGARAGAVPSHSSPHRQCSACRRRADGVRCGPVPSCIRWARICSATYGFIAPVSGLPTSSVRRHARSLSGRRLHGWPWPAPGASYPAALSLWPAYFVGFNAWFITAGAALAMLSTGCSTRRARAGDGWFSRNIGLSNGLINTVCRGMITPAMALVAGCPSRHMALLAGSTSRGHRITTLSMITAAEVLETRGADGCRGTLLLTALLPETRRADTWKVTAHFRARDLQSIIHIVGEGGLEPPRPEGHWHLKPARLPFRHSPQQPGSLSLDAPRSPTVPIRPRRPPPSA